ncbi:histone-like nucleoid-structuring protein Lsr2 [Humidisolicoccus flavus]|uniref:histone-like nucleoid-structuring protein Lsr2 n=1 Tax=Humidisolicoccus flavus TaxID=3111414 RepID=UPI00324C80F2
MAKKTVIELVDDIGGETIEDGDGRTVEFAVGGQSYEIDLTNERVSSLYSALQPYVDAARKVSGGKRAGTRRAVASSSHDLQAVREWAEKNGHTVASRGRIPQAVLEAYSNRSN